MRGSSWSTQVTKDPENADIEKQIDMNQSSPLPRRLPVLGFSWAMFLLFAGTLCVCLAFLAVCWRMLNFYHVQQQAFQSKIHSFNQILLTDLHQLINRTDAHATEDLCQIRFRMRADDGVSLPAESFSLELSRQDERTAHVERSTLDVSSGPIANFGLMPPGSYCLSVTNSWGMVCRHDFRVIPGVPVDRAILCPTRPRWMISKPPFSLHLKPAWPREWESKPIVAVYHLEAAGIRLGRWNWSAPIERSFAYWAAAERLGRPISETRIRDAMPAAFKNDPMPPSLEILTEEPMSIPYGDCRISAISFLLDRSVEENRFIHLQTIWFSGPDGSPIPREVASSNGITVLAKAPPRHVVNPSAHSTWEVSIPSGTIPEVLTLMDQERNRPLPTAKRDVEGSRLPQVRASAGRAWNSVSTLGIVDHPDAIGPGW